MSTTGLQLVSSTAPSDLAKGKGALSWQCCPEIHWPNHAAPLNVHMVENCAPVLLCMDTFIQSVLCLPGKQLVQVSSAHIVLQGASSRQGYCSVCRRTLQSAQAQSRHFVKIWREQSPPTTALTQSKELMPSWLTVERDRNRGISTGTRP